MNGFPDIPGLDQLVEPATDAAINLAGAAAIRAVFGDVWGIFSRYGVPVLLADTVMSVGYSNSSTVSNAKVEKGTFTSFNKVQDPYSATVVMASGQGSALARGAFLAQIEAISRSTLLYYVITPDYVHRNANVTGFSYSRKATQGARIIEAEIYLEEVRQTDVEYEDTEQVENPADASPADAGQVDPAAPQESILNRVSDFISESVGDSSSWGDYLGG